MISRRSGTQYRAGTAVDFFGGTAVIDGAAIVLAATVWLKVSPAVIDGAAVTMADTTVATDSPSVIDGAADVLAATVAQTMNATVGTKVWLRADLGTTIDTGVSLWEDQGPSGNDVAQATGGLQPTLQATAGPNSTPCLRGDGTDDTLVSAGFTWNQPEHVWIVAKFNRVGGGSDTAMDGLTSGKMRFAIFDATTVYAAAGATLGATTTPSAWHYYELQYNGASSKISVDGGSYTTGDTGANNAGGLSLFDIGGGGLPAQVDIAEVIGFAGIQSADMITNMRAYLHSRYGL